MTMQLVVAAPPNPGPMHPLTTNGPRYTWRIVDLDLDPVLRNFVLSAHGCCVWSEHLTAPSTENPICRRLTRSGILICPPDSRPTELLAALPCCPDCILRHEVANAVSEC